MYVVRPRGERLGAPYRTRADVLANPLNVLAFGCVGRITAINFGR